MNATVIYDTAYHAIGFSNEIIDTATIAKLGHGHCAEYKDIEKFKIVDSDEAIIRLNQKCEIYSNYIQFINKDLLIQFVEKVLMK